MKRFAWLMILPALFAVGCTKYVRVTDYKTSALPLEGRAYTVLKKSEAQSSSFKLLFFFDVTDDADWKKAEEIAISKEAADNLIGVSEWEEVIWFPLGRIRACYVSGKAVKYTESEPGK